MISDMGLQRYVSLEKLSLKTLSYFLKMSYIMTSSLTEGKDPGVRRHDVNVNPPG